jgi:hypothetical protein
MVYTKIGRVIQALENPGSYGISARISFMSRRHIDENQYPGTDHI